MGVLPCLHQGLHSGPGPQPFSALHPSDGKFTCVSGKCRGKVAVSLYITRILKTILQHFTFQIKGKLWSLEANYRLSVSVGHLWDVRPFAADQSAAAPTGISQSRGPTSHNPQRAHRRGGLHSSRSLASHHAAQPSSGAGR